MFYYCFIEILCKKCVFDVNNNNKKTHTVYYMDVLESRI